MSLRALQGPTGGGAPVGGSGTTNTIPRWTGASTLGDSGLIDNGTAIYTTTRNVGIGTASPTATSTIYKANNSLGAWNAQDLSVDGLSNGDAVYQRWYATGVAGAVGRFGVTFQSSVASFVWNSLFNSGVQTAELMRLTGGGNLGIGTASPGAQFHVERAGGFASNAEYVRLRNTTVASGSNVSHSFFVNGNTVATGTISHTWNGTSYDTIFNVWNGSTIAEAGRAVGGSTPVLSVPSGLKLPATPGNGNANTLDSYQEGTRVLSAGDLSGWTYVTATQYWTLVGRTVTLHTVFSGGTSSATGGATIATPPLLTPLRIAAGAAVNSSGTALGNGVCVVVSTSSTTGTVITSNAISSSAVDKVITVTYETAGL